MRAIIFLILFIITSCYTNNVHLIKDEFGNTEFYKTDYLEIKKIDSSLRLRFRSTANNIIVLEVEYSDNKSYDISKDNRIIIEFEDNTSIKLPYLPESATIDLITRTTTGVDFNPYNTTRYSAPITTYISKYIIKAEGQLKIFNKKVTNILVERKDSTKEYKVSSIKSSQLLSWYEKLQSKLTTNIK